jgi:hypothetical protein
MKFRIFLVALGFIISSPASAAQTSNDELMKSCEKKTIVFNKQGNRVGEKLDGFCTGYLQATFHALLNSKGSECKISEAKEAEYLFSVYQTYVKEKKTPPSESASSTLLQAFKRALDCK